MRYMAFVKMAEDVGEPPQALFEAMDKYVAEQSAAGVFVDGGGLSSPADSYELRLSGGQIAATDGPFTEAKEVVGGYSVLEYRSEEEALAGAREFLELHERHWPGIEVTVELRQIFGGPEDTAS